ncbi:MAG: DoxX family protein [Phycisphaeraceae bacterium]|nr:DoxX family protein [Phycisphaeraceae bacterium]
MSAGKGMQGCAAWAPLLLRLAVGVTFVWAGLGKFLASAELPSSTRPVLREMGAIRTSAGKAEQPRTTEGDHAKTGQKDDGPKEDEDEAKTIAGAVGSGEDAESGPVRVRRVWALGLRVYTSANPQAVGKVEGAQGSPMALWPRFIGSARWSAFWGWSVGFAEVAFGGMVLVGLLTRLGGVGLAGVMLGALWLDQIGPAVQMGGARLGFLPTHDMFDVRGWMPLLWQVSLLASSLALVLLGSGRLALERWLFGSKAGDDHDEL